MSSQIALITITGAETDQAVYLNGILIMSADPVAGDDLSLIEDTAQQLAAACDTPIQRCDYPISVTNTEWNWQEVTIDLINAGKLAAPSGKSDLMKGFYRCEGCGEHWTLVDDANAAMTCEACGNNEIEPYSSLEADACDQDPAAMAALAQHEQAHPFQIERGTYEITITRTATQSATINVDCTGPGSAYLKALDVAGDAEFSGDNEAEYAVEGGSLRRTLP